MRKETILEEIRQYAIGKRKSLTDSAMPTYKRIVRAAEMLNDFDNESIVNALIADFGINKLTAQNDIANAMQVFSDNKSLKKYYYRNFISDELMRLALLHKENNDFEEERRVLADFSKHLKANYPEEIEEKEEVQEPKLELGFFPEELGIELIPMERIREIATKFGIQNNLMLLNGNQE